MYQTITHRENNVVSWVILQAHDFDERVDARSRFNRCKAFTDLAV